MATESPRPPTAALPPAAGADALLAAQAGDGREGPKDAAAPGPQPAPEPTPDTWGFDLLLYGNEQILRGSDHGTLVAFGAIAFQQLRGKSEHHQNVGCGILLFSVLMCAIVHLAIGAAFVGRARRLLRGERARRRGLVRNFAFAIAIVAAVLQCVCIVLGLILILTETPPPLFEDNLLRWFE
jgi:hypothetical protein